MSGPVALNGRLEIISFSKLVNTNVFVISVEGGEEEPVHWFGLYSNIRVCHRVSVILEDTISISMPQLKTWIGGERENIEKRGGREGRREKERGEKGETDKI